MINFNYNIQLGMIISFIIIQFLFVILVITCKKSPPVYCLMITGYKDERLPFARKSIQNFHAQSYKNKFLIVINQSKTKLIKQNTDNLLEMYVDSTKLTLGELRNMSLQFVPPNAIWTTWDDDDIRHNDYISIMTSNLLKKNVDCLFFKNRIEYNLNSKFSFVMTLKSGFMTMFCRKHPEIQYEHVATNEDVQVKYYIQQHLKFFVYNNSPNLYIRLTHENNTSIYVNKHKKELIDTTNNKSYYERELSPDEHIYLQNIMFKYYKNNVI